MLWSSPGPPCRKISGKPSPISSKKSETPSASSTFTAMTLGGLPYRRPAEDVVVYHRVLGIRQPIEENREHVCVDEREHSDERRDGPVVVQVGTHLIEGENEGEDDRRCEDGAAKEQAVDLHRVAVDRVDDEPHRLRH